MKSGFCEETLSAELSVKHQYLADSVFLAHNVQLDRLEDVVTCQMLLLPQLRQELRSSAAIPDLLEVVALGCQRLGATTVPRTEAQRDIGSLKLLLTHDRKSIYLP